MPPPEQNPPPPEPAAGLIVAEVRYSLPELLREVQLERAATAFAMEKLEQTEITRLFEKRKAPRALKSRK